MKLDLEYVQAFKDRHGRWRFYFRKRGCQRRALPSDPTSLEFHAVYQEALASSVAVKPGENRSAHGTVAWLIAEYLDAPDFTTRPHSVRIKHRKHCEALRAEHGDKRVAKLEAEHVERMFAKMASTPAAANQWRVAMRDLMKFAVRRKAIITNPAADLRKMASMRPDGHHTWSLGQVEAFRAKHPVGTKARLALELMVELALRRSDVIRLGPPLMRGGILTYTQHKMRNRHPVEVVVELPAELARIISATTGTGLKTWLVDGHGKPFTQDAFSHWFADMVKAAGISRDCTPHGLRKRASADLADAGATSKEIGSITGHTTLKEIERYTRAADRKRLAASAMSKSLRNKTARD